MCVKDMAQVMESIKLSKVDLQLYCVSNNYFNDFDI